MAISPPPYPRRDTNIPAIIVDEIKELEDWAIQNLKDSKKERFRYWLLKLPALLASSGAGLFAYFKFDIGALIIGAIGSICVLIDGLYPSGTLRNVHLRAHHDLRALQQRIAAEWRIAALENNSNSNVSLQDSLSAQILKKAQMEKERIGSYIRDAETSLGANKE
ncbi:MAG: hypothetical protein ACR65R_07470 [Methylomicrobium sp.]